ncbi:MAG: thioredoxin-disulfide reductase [Lachnospiraceae bacterium]|nr:thioredoxin-disulfide reductase [Lachnospiraceae bacterium]
MEYDIIIVGAGTAGLSAAIYGLRSGKQVLVLEKMNYGGQIVNTSVIENYPGIANISGFEFATNLYKQAVNLGSVIRYEKVIELREEGQYKFVLTEQSGYKGKTVILATGAKNRLLGLKREEELTGYGVSYCAACDGMFYKGKRTAVVGGGNTALEDALVLSSYCEKVFLIHRRETLRGEEIRLKALREKENVEFLLNCQVEKLHGKERLEKITIFNDQTGIREDVNVDGIFVAIGRVPENEIFEKQIKLDFSGYIIAGEECRTSLSGVFAAGDCRTKRVRQLATAAADGAVAALQACEYMIN